LHEDIQLDDTSQLTPLRQLGDQLAAGVKWVSILAGDPIQFAGN
jgi:hypothetical protein